MKFLIENERDLRLHNIESMVTRTSSRGLRLYSLHAQNFSAVIHIHKIYKMVLAIVKYIRMLALQEASKSLSPAAALTQKSVTTQQTIGQINRVSSIYHFNFALLCVGKLNINFCFNLWNVIR